MYLGCKQQLLLTLVPALRYQESTCNWLNLSKSAEQQEATEELTMDPWNQ